MSAPEGSFTNATVTDHDRLHSAYITAATSDDHHPHLTGYHPNFLDDFLPAYAPDEPRDSPCLFPHIAANEGYCASLSPPSASFLDAIPNPADFDYYRSSPFTALPSPFRHGYTTAGDMPPSTRAHPQGSRRPARLPNGYVDLTSTPDSPPRRRKRESPAPGPSSKRQKREHGTAAERESPGVVKVEEVDLTDDKQSVREILQKQQEDAVKAQAKQEEKATTFNTFNCVICMDTPTDLTATACGHLFCHTCLMEALIAGENRSGPGEQKRSQCPVCRKFINRSKPTDIIPLLLKKGLATQPKKKVVSLIVAAAVAAATTAAAAAAAIIADEDEDEDEDEEEEEEVEAEEV